MKIQTKHIDRLSQSKKSGIRIGSRGIPHRLRKYEQKRIDIAREKGYLILHPDDRMNIRNIWEAYREVESEIPWIAQKNIEKNITIISANGIEKHTIDTISTQEIQKYIQSLGGDNAI